MSVVGLNSSSLDTKRGICHTRTFWQLTRQSLPMRPTHWRQTAGSEALLEPGGLPTLLPYLLITTPHEASFVLLFVLITYLWVCSVAR
jgi:hypothetical protein